MKIVIINNGADPNGSCVHVRPSTQAGIKTANQKKKGIVLDAGPNSSSRLSEYIEKGVAYFIITHTHGDHMPSHDLFYLLSNYTHGQNSIPVFIGPGEGFERNPEADLLDKNKPIHSLSWYLLNAINSSATTGKEDLVVEVRDLYFGESNDPYINNNGKDLEAIVNKFFLKQGSGENSSLYIREKDGSEKLKVKHKIITLIEDDAYTIKAAYGIHGIPVVSALSITEYFKPSITVDNNELKKLGLAKDKWVGDVKKAYERNVKNKHDLRKELSNIIIKNKQEEYSALQLLNMRVIKENKTQSKFTYITDTILNSSTTQPLLEIAENSDILIVGANKFFEEQNGGRGKYHLSPRDAAFIASQSKSEVLYIVHIPRIIKELPQRLITFYTAPQKMSDYYRRAVNVVEEARGIFPNTYLAMEGLVVDTLQPFAHKSKKWSKIPE